ncbi:hypothetical protein BsWGS_13942 [Bradybaena similaris]
MFEMLRSGFGKSCLSGSKIFEWYSHFNSGCWSFKHHPRQGRPSTYHTDEILAHVQEIIHADRCMTIREVAEDIGISIGICHKKITEDLHERQVTEKLMPHFLTKDLKDEQLSICTDLRERAKNDANLMSSIMTGDEHLVHEYGLETFVILVANTIISSTEEGITSPTGQIQYQDHVDCVLQR